MFKRSKRVMISSVHSMRLRKFTLLLASLFLGIGVSLESVYSSYFGVSSEKSFRHLMEETITVMNRGIKEAPMTGDPDHDFPTMMIPHHQGAVDMAKAYLLYGKDPVLRRLAQEIIVTQSSEIAVMEAELKRYSSQLKQAPKHSEH